MVHLSDKDTGCCDMVVAGCDDGTLHVWDGNTGEVLSSILGHNKPIIALEHDNGIVLTCSATGEIRIWQLVHAARGGVAQQRLSLIKEKCCPGAVCAVMLYSALLMGNVATVSLIVVGDMGVYRLGLECELSSAGENEPCDTCD